MVTFETNQGNFTFKLDHEKAPRTAENFLDYARSGFYDNTLFHRVINGFVIQGGGFDEDMSQKPTKEHIENEADKTSANVRGSVAMARTSDPHSATSQFFINLRDNDFLDFRSKDNEGWGYCVFAHVTDGMDVIDKISEVETTTQSGHQDVPTEQIIVKKVTVSDDEKT